MFLGLIFSDSNLNHLHYRFLFIIILLRHIHVDYTKICTLLGKITILFMMSRWPQLFWLNPIILRADLTRLYMYIYIFIIYCYVQLCTNKYFDPNYFSAKGDNSLFPWSVYRTTYEVDHTWCLSYHGKFLCGLRSKLLIFQST